MSQRRYPIRDHAILRFWERWRPDLEDRDDVVAEMQRLAWGAKHMKSGPAWHYAPSESNRFLRGYLRVNPSLVFCLAFYVGEGVQISTVLVRVDKQKRSTGVTPPWVVELRRDRVDQVIRTTVRRARQ